MSHWILLLGDLRVNYGGGGPPPVWIPYVPNPFLDAVGALLAIGMAIGVMLVAVRAHDFKEKE